MKKINLLMIVVVILSVNTSCLKKQNLNDDGLGPAIAPASLKTAMSEGVGALYLDDIKAGEVSSFVYTQKLQDSYADTVEQQEMTVKNVETTPEHFIFNSSVTVTSYSSGQETSKTTREWPWQINFTAKPTPANPNQQANEIEAPIYLFELTASIMTRYCYSDDAYSPQTCHNLVTSDIQYKVPPGSMSQHGCLANSDCKISARKIEFDRISLNEVGKDGKAKRSHITIILSKQVPFLSRMLQYCQRGLYDIQNSQVILLDACYTINNYVFPK